MFLWASSISLAGNTPTGANEEICEPYKVFAKTKEDLMPYLLMSTKRKQNHVLGLYLKDKEESVPKSVR